MASPTRPRMTGIGRVLVDRLRDHGARRHRPLLRPDRPALRRGAAGLHAVGARPPSCTSSRRSPWSSRAPAAGTASRGSRSCFELVGVLVVGTLSFVLPELFAHPTVWSWFGMRLPVRPAGAAVLRHLVARHASPVDARRRRMPRPPRWRRDRLPRPRRGPRRLRPVGRRDRQVRRRPHRPPRGHRPGARGCRGRRRARRRRHLRPQPARVLRPELCPAT